MVSVILSEHIAKGYCCVLADNVYVFGHSFRDTIDNWASVLDTLNINNLKLSPRKTFCFPESLELLGWIKKGKYLYPDPHRQNTLITASLPRTVKELRSFLGS